MQQIDIYKVIEGKSPKLAKRIPGFIINWLKRTIHQDEINEMLRDYCDLKDIEFVRAALKRLDISYRSAGMDKLDPKGRYVFASNHPFGGLDGLMLAVEAADYFGGVKVIVNDLLMHLDPIKGLFVPVNKHGKQNTGSVAAFNDAFDSDVPIITFPAGLVSRRKRGIIRDPEWKSNFIRKAVQSERDVVPVFFGGKLSDFFYRLSNIRNFFGIRVNIEMLFLPDQMFRQKGSSFEIRIGVPIPYSSLLDGRSGREAAEFVRGRAYALGGAAEK